RRLIAAGGRLRVQITREQIGTVRFEQQPVRGYAAHQGEEVSAAPLVADPAGDPNRETEVEISVELVGTAGETVGHASAEQRATVFPQNRQEVLVCIALVQEHGLADPCGQFELTMEGLLLHRAR